MPTILVSVFCYLSFDFVSDFGLGISDLTRMDDPREVVEMARKYLAFDIETAKDIPGEDFHWEPHRPLGICCAAALSSGSTDPIIWHGKNADGSAAGKMSQTEVRAMVKSLAEWMDQGFTLLTWNGLGFDLDIVAEEADDLEACRSLAMGHVDMMFHIFCDRGFPVALDKAAQGLRIPGKPAGMTGYLAPKLWADGRHREVIEYVSQDVRLALQIAEICETQQAFRWTTRRGTVSSMDLHAGWLTVAEALNLPSPDTSWMSDPIPRQRFTKWLQQGVRRVPTSTSAIEA